MLIERLVLRKADHLVAISEMTRAMIKSQGIAGEKITLAHNGVDLSRIKKTDAAADVCDVIYFGRLVTHKNVDVLIRAAAILVLKKPNLRVHIVGGGPELDNLKRIASTLELENTVKFFGTMESHEDAMALLKASKVFVQPSTSEGGGSIALMEAYACGLPVIAITHPQGIDPALISHNLTGLWLPALSPELMADALSQLLIDDIREPMRRLIEKMSENYDWQSICAVYDELFGLLSNRINPKKKSRQ
jgi:glycosyltransferase involved in cell wall biosynthesis